MQRLWWRGPTGPDDAVVREANDLLDEGNELPIHESLLVSARRKLHQGDYRGAIIDSISAVESLLGPVISMALERRNVSKSKRRSYLGAQGIGLSQQMHVTIPSLFGPDAIEKSLRDSFSAASGKRNKIVHEGSNAGSGEAEMHFETCSQVIEQLMELKQRLEESDEPGTTDASG